MFISIFSDELGVDVTAAVPIIKSWGVEHVDFRGRVFRKGIEALDEEELKRLRQLVDDAGMTVGCLQTSLCKVHLPDADRQKKEAEKLEGIIRATEALDCRLVRSFHYWQPERTDAARAGALAVQPDAMQQVLDRFGPIADRAQDAGLVLAFENCGVTPDEVFALLDALDVPDWGLAWDVANTWDCEARRQDEGAYIERMVKRSKCVHVKASGALDWLGRELIPYGKVMRACHSLGMTGPVSAETHNPDKTVSNEDASRQVVEAIRRAWPAAAPESVTRATNTLVRAWDEDPVGFLVVGLGMGHCNAEKVYRTSGCKLVAVSDLKEERAKRTGEQFEAPWFTDYRECLNNEDVEVVYVVTETGKHAEVAIAALKAGKHVLTTKPMEASLTACDEMLKVAEAKGLVLAVDFNKRFEASTLTLKRSIEEGAFGRLLSAQSNLKILRTMDYFRENGGWRGTRKMDGGGVFSNQAIHNIDEIVFCLGAPVKVRAELWTQDHAIEAEDLGISTWIFDDGLVLNLHATTCYAQPTWYTTTELTGDKGAFFHAGGGPFEKRIDKWYLDGAWTETAPTVVESEWLNAPDNMAAHLRTGAKLVCDGRAGRRSQAVLDAMYRSAYDHGGGWVEVHA